MVEGPELNELGIVLGVGKKFEIDEAIVTYTSKVEVKDWIYAKSKLNCRACNKSNFCVNHAITPLQMNEMLREYKKAVFVCGKENQSENDFKLALLEMEKALNHKFYKAIALTGELKLGNHRPALEGSGIDMVSLAKKLKKRSETQPFGLILVD